jgi:hypothetical protein
MDSRVGDKPNEVHLDEAAIHSSDDEAHHAVAVKHDGKNHNVSHNSGDAEVTWKTWFVIMVRPSRCCLS